jgi:cysteine synthase
MGEFCEVLEALRQSSRDPDTIVNGVVTGGNITGGLLETSLRS